VDVGETPCTGVQPVRVKLTPLEYVTVRGIQIDRNRSIRLLLRLCLPYAADFDDDEMSIFPVKSPEAIEECRRFKWNHEIGHPDVREESRSITPSRSCEQQQMDHRLKLNWIQLPVTLCTHHIHCLICHSRSFHVILGMHKTHCMHIGGHHRFMCGGVREKCGCVKVVCICAGGLDSTFQCILSESSISTIIGMKVMSGVDVVMRPQFT
jgi:hypothetical protein